MDITAPEDSTAFEAFDGILNQYLFDTSVSPAGQIINGILPFAEMENAVRDRLYRAKVYLERTELPVQDQIEQLLASGLVVLAKTALLNGMPTDTALCGTLDKALYQECIARLDAQPERWQERPVAETPDMEAAL